MKTLELKELEKIYGGNDVSQTILGACAAIGAGGALGIIALANPYGVGIAAVCITTGLGEYFNWW